MGPLARLGSGPTGLRGALACPSGGRSSRTDSALQSKAILAQARGAFPRQTNHRRRVRIASHRCGACNQRNMPTDGSCRASVHAFGITAVAWRGAEWSVSVGKRTAVRTSSLTARRKVIERVLSLAHADSQPRLPHAQHSTSDKAEAQRFGPKPGFCTLALVAQRHGHARTPWGCSARPKLYLGPRCRRPP